MSPRHVLRYELTRISLCKEGEAASWFVGKVNEIRENHRVRRFPDVRTVGIGNSYGATAESIAATVLLLPMKGGRFMKIRQCR
jgi:hypothetical protein